jgi:hypothetical protein
MRKWWKLWGIGVCVRQWEEDEAKHDYVGVGIYSLEILQLFELVTRELRHALLCGSIVRSCSEGFEVYVPDEQPPKLCVASIITHCPNPLVCAVGSKKPVSCTNPPCGAPGSGFTVVC